jgi:hypothetical protein
MAAPILRQPPVTSASGRAGPPRSTAPLARERDADFLAVLADRQLDDLHRDPLDRVS